jgi:two-component system response regulator RstA
LLRRVKEGPEPSAGQSVASGEQNRVTFANLVVDNGMREAWLDEEPIDLTSAEFDLLWLLSSNAGRVLSREEIFTALRGIEYDGQDRSIDVRISRIRPKIGDDPLQPKRIKTVRSKGYLFVKEI